ncbi:MAG TPA: glycerophosphodiester phosphodiesterase [Dehalococcoidales bacterium]|jgi:glycerophosphoryl diester phosphodiesterase|nr:glycerophosphodiester phosphodiesterase [Dehalococcoidales bacterium]
MKHVLNIAHRGFTRDFPDNTLESFEAAIRIPVDAIECDVRETADGHFVIYHDAELSGRDIGHLSLSEIKDTRLRGRFRIPTLEETLDLCHERVRLNVEVKRVDSLARFLDILRAGIQPDEVFLTSFNRDLVMELASLAPDIRRGVITATPMEDHVTLVRETGADMIIVMFPSVNTDLVREADEAGLPVFVWGFADMTQVRIALDLGVDGIITDFPDQARAELERMGKNSS